MASATAPSTPGSATPSPFRRSFTLPSRLSDTPKSHVDSTSNETLFAHHTCRIVSFDSPLPSSKSRSGSTPRGDPDGEPVGTLPWASHTERTLAAAPLKLYRVSTGTVFLSSGQIIHAIQPKSRCWCVDNETKFVLRINETKYYRIELPNKSHDDKQVAEELKEVLAKVLLYEVTTCPFKRGHTVELPPEKPVILRPWKAKHSPVSSANKTSRYLSDPEYSPDNSANGISEESTDEEIHSTGTEHLIASPLSEGTTKKEGHDQSAKATTTTPLTEETVVEQRHDQTSNTLLAGLSSDEPEISDLDYLKTPTRPRVLKEIRSVTAPPQLTINPLPSSGDGALLTRISKQDPETASIASIDSFHSFTSFYSTISPLPPSPPPSPPYTDPPSPSQRPQTDFGIDIPKSRQHKRDISELTVTAATFSFPEDNETPTWRLVEKTSTPLCSTAPALNNDAVSQNSNTFPSITTPSSKYPEFSTTSSPSTVVRRRRAYSPLPPPANIYSPRTRLTGHHLTSAILHKTCSLLLGPPIQLVALMLNIAAKIANGAYYGIYQVPGYGSLELDDDGDREHPGVHPGAWDYSDGEDEANNVWEEDDYGISLGVVQPSRTRREKDIGGSWEID